MNGVIVLQNKSGQVVRTFHTQTAKVTMVYRRDTKRVESVANVKDLEKAGVEYELLAEVSKKDIAAAPVPLGRMGTLKLVSTIEELSPTVALTQEDPERFPKFVKITAASHVAVIIFSFLVSYVVTKMQPEEIQPQVVKVIPRTRIVVSPMEHKKVAPKIVQKKNSNRKVVQSRSLRKSTVARRRQAPSMNINQMGALGVLGSLSKSAHRGGIDLNAAKATRGPGLGGNAGSGGIQSSVYARGLVAAPLGPGARATGMGGYGTRGKGGGQAGFGQMTMIGSSNAYFQPVSKEAIVEGGLDRDQIAAVIEKHLGQIRFCYEQGLQLKPGLNGRVAVKFIIGGNGFVNVANVQNTSLRSDDVESCIVQRLKSWKFPEPRGGVNVKVTYPFVLRRVSQS